MATSSPSVKQTSGANDVVKKFNASWSYAQKNQHTRWNRNWKLYNNERWKMSYQGTTNTFVPMVFSTVETLTAALAAGRPSTDFMPQDMYQYIESYAATGQKPDLKALNAQYDYYWDCDNWDLTSIKTIRTGFIYGTSCEWVHWDVDKPRIMNLNPRDAIIDPALTDPMQLITHPNDFYTGRRYLTTKEALSAEKVPDPETGELKPRFKKLQLVRPGQGPDGQSDREVKEMWAGALGETSDLIEVIEIVTGDRIRSVANRCVDIEDRPNTLGMHNLVIHRFIADESLIYGKSIIDPIALAQELLNDVTNQRVDAVTDILSPQYELDPAYSDQLAIVANSGPGTVFPFAKGSLSRIDKGVVPNSAFNEGMNIKNEIREATGADQVVKGVESDNQTTATEIKAQLNQAGQRFELYVRMLEREGFYQRAKIVYKMMLTYVSDLQLVPTNTLDGPKFRKFDPTSYGLDYEPKIQLEATVKGAQRRLQNDTLQAYQAMIADPTNDLWEVKKILYPKMFELSEEELDRIIGTEKPNNAMSGAGGAAMPGEEMPPAMPEMPL
jgi:hypothetical protein